MKKRYSAGFTIIEISATVILLLCCLVVFSQLAVFVSMQRGMARNRQAALDQLTNVVEQLAEVPDESLLKQDFDSTRFQELTERILPEGKIEFSLQPDSLQPDSSHTDSNTSVQTKVFRITISWSEGSNRPRAEMSIHRFLHE